MATRRFQRIFKTFLIMCLTIGRNFFFVFNLHQILIWFISSFLLNSFSGVVISLKKKKRSNHRGNFHPLYWCIWLLIRWALENRFVTIDYIWTLIASTFHCEMYVCEQREREEGRKRENERNWMQSIKRRCLLDSRVGEEKNLWIIK